MDLLLWEWQTKISQKLKHKENLDMEMHVIPGISPAEPQGVNMIPHKLKNPEFIL